MPHFLLRSDAGDWDEDEVIEAFAQNPKLRNFKGLPMSFPSSKQVAYEDMSAGRPTGSARTISWMDHVTTAPNRRSSNNVLSSIESIVDTRRPGHLPGVRLGPRGSPSNLRATAPAFDLSFHPGDNQNAISDDYEELAERLGSATLLSSPQDASSRYLHHTPRVYPRTSEVSNSFAHSQKQRTSFLGNVTSRSSLQSRSIASGSSSDLNTPPIATIDMAGPFQSPVSQGFVPKPRANTFSSKTLSKLPKSPSHTLGDFACSSLKNGLHDSASCFAVVEFKTFRAEVYQIRLDWNAINGVSVVIVEADRGFDLGKVHLVTANLEEARNRKKELYYKHWNVLIESSTQKEIDEATSAQCFEAHYGHVAGSPHTAGSVGSMWPKSVVGRATADHMQQLQLKEGAEEKAKRACQKIADNLGMNMEILAAEFQFDWQKLTLFYLSPEYIQYERISNEIFKLYKCRLWYTALNPASFHPPKAEARLTRRTSIGSSDPSILSPQMLGPLPPLPEVQHTPSDYFMSDHTSQLSRSDESDKHDSGYSTVMPTVARTSPWNETPPPFSHPRGPWKQWDRQNRIIGREL